MLKLSCLLTDITADSYYKPEEIYNQLNSDTLDLGNEEDDGLDPFQRLAKEMIPLTGKVKLVTPKRNML